MAKLVRNKAILAKIETTYGTDPTPTGSANAMLVKNLTITPIAADVVSRDLIRPYLGNSDQLVAGNHVEIEFDIEMQASGTLGTAPAYGPLLRACGFAETVTASTMVEYEPVSSGFESVAIYAWEDGILHKMLGCRGNMNLEISARGIPFFRFRMVGKYAAPTDTALPTADYSDFVDPLVANSTNTPTFSFFGVSSLVLESLTLDMGNQVDYRALIGSETTQITDRKVSGQLSCESVALSSFNPFSLALGTSTGALQIVHGTASGRRVQIDCPRVDIGAPSYADSGGVSMFNIPVVAMPDSGNDEIKLTFI